MPAELTYATTPTGALNRIETIIGEPATEWITLALTATGRVKIATPPQQNPALNHTMIRAALHRLECDDPHCPDCTCTT